MKIIPYLRFAWATLILTNFATQTNFPRDPLFLIILTGLFTMTFSVYCIVIGLQEIKNKEIVEAKYFESFGLVVEIMTFLAGVFVLTTLIGQEDFLKITIVTAWQVGLTLLIIIDIQRVWIS